MKKLIPIAVIFSFAVWSGCSSDDPTPTEPPPPPPPVRVVANTMVGAPTLSSVDEAIWANVTEFTLDISTQNSPKLPAPASSAVSDSVRVKAIVSGGELFLRIKFDDDSLNQLKDYHSIIGDPQNVNFTINDLAHEDQLYVLFSGLPDNASDVWSWRALETAPAGLAEGFTLRNDFIFRDSGGQVVAFLNATFNSTRPPWVHKDGSAFKGPVLYLEDRDAISSHISDPWDSNQVVPGYYIDTLVRNRVHPDSALRQSRWDIFTVFSFDPVNEIITVVLKRKLNTGWSEDLPLADSVQVRIGIFDEQEDFFLGNNSRRGFTDLFWLIL